METVSFTAMADGTREEYEFLQSQERQVSIPDHVLALFETVRGSSGGYQISRYEHALQTATRAHRAGESEEYVVAALLHDLGECIAPERHGEIAAAVLAPHVSDELVWIVKHHGLFQMYYYAHHFGDDRNVRDQYRDHPYYDACVRFCEIYDQCSFDPDYDTEPVEFFTPMVRRVLGGAEPST
jgi:predicted HD phosphohydrolase